MHAHTHRHTRTAAHTDPHRSQINPLPRESAGVDPHSVAPNQNGSPTIDGWITKVIHSNMISYWFHVHCIHSAEHRKDGCVFSSCLEFLYWYPVSVTLSKDLSFLIIYECGFSKLTETSVVIHIYMINCQFLNRLLLITQIIYICNYHIFMMHNSNHLHVRYIYNV